MTNLKAGFLRPMTCFHTKIYISQSFIRVGVGSKGMAAMRAVATYLTMARIRILEATPYVD